MATYTRTEPIFTDREATRPLTSAQLAEDIVANVGVEALRGPAGRDGVGVPPGGLTGEVLFKGGEADHVTSWGPVTGGSIADAALQARHLADTMRPSAAAGAGSEALRALGAARGQAAPGRDSVGRVAHGSNADAVRPAGYALVVWVGSAQPTGWLAGDIWVRTS